MTTQGNVLNLDFAKAKTVKYLTVNSTGVKKNNRFKEEQFTMKIIAKRAMPYQVFKFLANMQTKIVYYSL